ncbi:ATP-binding protein [Phenylobacterium sp. LjRoot225]|uniref:ATP-binding protein n=1 Tax=Phenylobacterium sp. LjRoot225 TaxID=3342285 RepID=UPI003ED15F9C
MYERGGLQFMAGWWSAGLSALRRRSRFGRAQDLAAAEARAALAEARLGAVLEAFPEGVVLLDPEGRYVMWNQAYADIYHRSADLFEPGQRLVDVLRIGVERGDYPDAVGREEQWLAERERQLLESGARHEQHLADGRWLLIEDRRTADGGMLGLRVDITDMKEQTLALARAVAAAEAANRAKSEFLANVSHEIRTPLHGILGMTQVLARDETLSDDQHARIGLIRQSGHQLLELLNDLLDLAKIEAGKLTLQAVAFQPAAIAQAACAPFENLAADKGLTLDLKLAALEGAVWTGDPLRLQQVLANLVSNAVKFTAHGRISVRAELNGAGEAEFRVADTGIGIPQERLAEVFEKFAQLESAKDRRFGGTGLGLALSRELAELMGGVLEAESAPGVGSVFSLRLPVTPAAAPSQDLDEARPTAAGPLDIRILAAEDNTTNQVILRALLEPLGAQLTLVGDGSEAIEAYRAGGFDLVLMDIQMPVTDGVSATREIRSLEAREGRPRTPIIALSANVMAHQVAEYRAAGMDAVVGKPFEAEALWSAVAELVLSDAPEARTEMATAMAS